MKIKLDENAIMPTRAHDTDAGLDLYAREDKVVPAGGSATFDTGVHVELPELMYNREVPVQHYDGGIDTATEISFLKTAAFLKSKSGLMVNHDITSDGTVDYGYTGSIKVKLFNHGTEDYHVRRGAERGTGVRVFEAVRRQGRTAHGVHRLCQLPVYGEVR